MSHIVEARTRQGLREVMEIVHDELFWVERVAFDREASLVRVPFERLDWDSANTQARFLFLHVVAIPRVRWVLEICNAKELSLNETENVGQYDFNAVSYDEETGIVSIKTGIPLHFDVRTSALLVRAINTGEVVEIVKRIEPPWYRRASLGGGGPT